MVGLRRLFNKKERLLYFPGCIASYVNKDIRNNWETILADLGTDFEVDDEIKCCGSPAYTAGYIEDFKKIVNSNLRRLKGIDKIISNCPHCTFIFSKFYGIKAVHTSQLLSKEMIGSEDGEEICYHDSCYLARKLVVIDEPRSALRAAGHDITEFSKSKDRTSCCGASGGMIYAHPSMANRICKKRLQSAPKNKIVVACPLCHYHMSNNKSDEQEIVELAEMFMKK